MNQLRQVYVLDLPPHGQASDKGEDPSESIAACLPCDHQRVGLDLVGSLFKQVHVAVKVAVGRGGAASPGRVRAFVPPMRSLYERAI